MKVWSKKKKKKTKIKSDCYSWRIKNCHVKYIIQNVIVFESKGSQLPRGLVGLMYSHRLSPLFGFDSHG